MTVTVRSVRSGCAAGRVLDVDILEEAQRADAGARAVDQHAVEGVAFHQAEFAADHLVEGAGVADDVDLLDIDARALLDVEDQIDGVVVAVARDARMDFGEGIALGAGGVGQRVDRFLHRLGVVDVAARDRHQRAQATAASVP